MEKRVDASDEKLFGFFVRKGRRCHNPKQRNQKTNPAKAGAVP